MIQVAPDLLEEGQVWLIPRIKAWEGLVQLKRNRWIPLNAADVYVCGLYHGIVKTGRAMIISAYLDNGDDLSASPMVRVIQGEGRRGIRTGPLAFG